MAVIWNDNVEFPDLCGYCSEGCSCGSPVGLELEDIQDGAMPASCDFCDYGCDCEDSCDCECECCECECECDDNSEFVVDADSYNKWVKENCYVCGPGCLTKKILKTGEKAPEKLFCKKDVGGNFIFGVRVMPYEATVFEGGLFSPRKKVTKRACLSIAEREQRSKVYFTGPVFIPLLIENTDRGGKIWMSLTPMEFFTQREAIDIATGRVLIGGLGMGWLTSKVLEKPNVTEVVQVDTQQHIMDFFGKPLQSLYPGKLKLITSDFYDYADSVNLRTFDTILVDIWPSYSGASFDRKFKEIYDTHHNVWGWGYEGYR